VKNLINKPFYFIRHGETDCNRRNVYIGSADVPLNQFGLQQAKIAAKLLETEPIDHIVSSPMLRATTTAEIIADQLGKKIIFVEELKECIIGNEGAAIGDAAGIRDWFEGKATGANETIAEFKKRIASGLQKVAAFDGMVLIVSHGGVYSSVRRILGLPSIYLRNCMTIYHAPPDQETHPWSISVIE
jgi:broad specificity phosphatase PhoE